MKFFRQPNQSWPSLAFKLSPRDTHSHCDRVRICYFPWVLLPNVVLKIRVARRWSLAELSDWDNTDVAALSIFLKTDAPISSFQHFNDSPVFLGFCSQIWFHKYAHRWHETFAEFPSGKQCRSYMSCTLCFSI